MQRLQARLAADLALSERAERLGDALAKVGAAIEGAAVEGLERELAQDSAAGEEMAGELRACAQEEAEIQTELRAEGELVTEAEVWAQRLRDQAAEAQESLRADRAAARPGNRRGRARAGAGRGGGAGAAVRAWRG